VLAERNRLARDIHDTLAQGFTGVIVQLEAAEDARAKGLPLEADDHVRRARELARESLGEARRSVHALRPKALEESDLCEALDSLIARMTAGTTLSGEFAVSGAARPLPPEWEDNLLHVVREVLANALRHARASRFATQVTFAPDMIRMDLRDDGIGFDTSARSDGFGLPGMSDRATRMGGQLTIQSAPGEGTAVSIAIPIVETAIDSR
jgi:signal transduction histidine kinase